MTLNIKEGEYTMSIKSITTDQGEQGNNFAFEFLNEIIPQCAAEPEWRDIFDDLANLSEEKRAEQVCSGDLRRCHQT